MSSTTFQEAIEDLSMFGIKEPYTYLIDIIPLIEMIWADGEAHESELAILDEYLHKRAQQINEMAGYAAIDFQGAQANGLHDRFDSDEKRCFYEIIMTVIDFKWPERMKKKSPNTWNHGESGTRRACRK